MKRLWIGWTLVAAGLTFGVPYQASEASLETRGIAVQHAGRVKTLETFAKEMLATTYGRSSWQKRPALSWLLDAASDPRAVAGWRWHKIDYRPLADLLGLEKGRNQFSFEEIIPSVDKIEALLRSASDKRDAEQPTSLLERKAESLYGGLSTTKAVIDGRVLRLVPPEPGSNSSEWTLIGAATPEWREAFDRVLAAHRAGDRQALAGAVRDWNGRVDARVGQKQRQTLTLEGFYFALRPFAWAAAAYLAGFLLLLVRGNRYTASGGALVLSGFLFHTFGLVLRCLILSRPPVSNMYESMVWMNWVLMAAAGILAAVRREKSPLTAGAIASAVVMIYGDLLPIDTGLDVLVPVLRSNYWLTIHVLTIVASYGLFGLAMALAHRHLWLDVRGRLKKADEERSAQLVYRSIQVGLLLLGIGTVLGGVWANESWGRFWGWDPKETWALITFLGYLVVVHLHYARVIRPAALAWSAIGGFLLVLFTWYGVNFVLGKGLHSYGQGSGGLNWILAYLGFEILFAGWVLARKLKTTGR